MESPQKKRKKKDFLDNGAGETVDEEPDYDEGCPSTLGESIYEDFDKWMLFYENASWNYLGIYSQNELFAMNSPLYLPFFFFNFLNG